MPLSNIFYCMELLEKHSHAVKNKRTWNKLPRPFNIKNVLKFLGVWGLFSKSPHKNIPTKNIHVKNRPYNNCNASTISLYI